MKLSRILGVIAAVSLLAAFAGPAPAVDTQLAQGKKPEKSMPKGEKSMSKGKGSDKVEEVIEENEDKLQGQEKAMESGEGKKTGLIRQMEDGEKETKAKKGGKSK